MASSLDGQLMALLNAILDVMKFQAAEPKLSVVIVATDNEQRALLRVAGKAR